MTTGKDTDSKYMKEALGLAEKGRGLVNPNPMVGAVIVKNGKIIGSGYHERYGELHAERNAIKSSTEPVRGSTMYVTLEPCCHTGKTPPCTDAITESGISRVVVGMRDPNPKVSGKGIEILRKNGVRVCESVMEEECRELNRVFSHYIKTGLPYVTMKYAMTMDGKIAAGSGDSKWITGEIAREHVHIQRSYNMGIMVGTGTVIKDDPMLTSRTDKGTKRDPVRIICDTRLTVPETSRIVGSAKDVPTIIATANGDSGMQKALEDSGCEIIRVKERNGHIDLSQLMRCLGSKGMDSILLEGGGSLNWSMLESGFVNKVQAYVAPKLLGGSESKTPVEGIGAEYAKNACLLREPRITRLGEDILMESEVVSCLQA